MRDTPHPPPPGWQMELFEVIPGLFIGTRLDPASDFGSLGVDVIVDLEDWGWAWVPPVPTGAMYLSYPMEDEDDVDPKVREVASFVASLVGSGRRVLVHCTEGLNRSGVVVARALMTIGRTADEAIQLVRERRGPSVDGFPALGNTAFVDWLRSEDASSSADRRTLGTTDRTVARLGGRRTLHVLHSCDRVWRRSFRP